MTDCRKLIVLAMTLAVATAGLCGSSEPKAWSYPPEIWSVWELDRARAYMRDEGLRVRYDGRFREPVKAVEFRKGPNGVPFAVSAGCTYGVPCVPGTGYESRIVGEAWLAGGDWRPCDVFETTGDLPPHRVGYEPVELKPAVGTTWMSAIECVALLLHGHRETVSRRIESVWGGMLDRGATTFWESWQPTLKGDAVPSDLRFAIRPRPGRSSFCRCSTTRIRRIRSNRKPQGFQLIGIVARCPS